MGSVGSDEQYSKEEVRLKALEAMAKEKKIGLWRDKNPVPPWEFRKRKREKSAAK